MTKYKSKPEVFLYGTDEVIKIPEIKVRYNRGKESQKITSSEDTYKFLKKVYGRDISLQEQTIILFLDQKLSVLGYYKHTVGTPVASLMDIPMIMGIAVKAMARSLIISHNHPSGNTKPSEADRRLTKDASKAARVLGLRLLDHLIVTKDNGHYSFADSENILDGLSQKEKSIEKKLREEIFFQLSKVNKTNAAHIHKLLQTESGYQMIEQRIIDLVIRERITPSAAIPQIETEL